MEDFGAVQVYTGAELQQENPAPKGETVLANIEQSRAVAEVQASIVLARSNPRNEVRAYSRIMKACKRKSLAERASYSFKRGGSLVTGPTIRLAEVLANSWENIHYGFREIGRKDDYSEIEAFAHDLETNTRVTRQFQVRHYRDLKNDTQKALTSERDKYEMVANMAQRRVRSCLLEIIPGDIVEAAEEACKATLLHDIGDIEKKAKAILEAFSKFGVTKEMVEKHLDRDIKSIVPADVVSLQGIYRSIRDGIAPVGEFFDLTVNEVISKTEIPPESDEKVTKNDGPYQWSTGAQKIIDAADNIRSADDLDKFRAGKRKDIDALGSESKSIFEYLENKYQALKQGV